MRNYPLLGTALVLLTLACQTDLPDTTTATPPDDPLPTSEINRRLYAALETQGVYDWATASDELLWSAAMQSDSSFAVGYQSAGFQNIETEIHRIDVNDATWTAARERVLDVILAGERELNPATTQEDLLPIGTDDVLPTLTVRFSNPATIRRLRELPELRYLEAMSYELPPLNVVDRSGSGCGAGPNYNLNSADYMTIAPNVKQSWHHASSNVSTAWNSSRGEGVTIAIIDTGASDSQDNLGSQFTAGQSGGRYVQKASTKYSGWWWWRKKDSPHDQCGHGTQMAGLATAPRGNDGNAVGVAYKSSLLSIRAVEDVIISSSDEKNGVKDALILAGNDNSVKVISMSIGSPFSSGTVSDGIYYAYNKGKFIAAAAGTSLSWTTWYGVIFPASMSQTVAVTGVRDGSPMDDCDICHSGSAVDFVMVMQRSGNNDRTALTLATSSNQPTYVGGSSAATASVAGIAALVFAEHPGATRQQVYDVMKENAGFYPNKHGSFGWGIVDAAAAVSDPL